MYIEEEYRDSKVRFVVTCTNMGKLRAVFTGTGSDRGTKTFIAIVEQALEKFSQSNLSVLMDLRNQSSVPFKTQIKMGAWLLSVKDKIDKIAIVGGGKAAQVIAKSAQMKHIRFFKISDIEIAGTWIDSL